jgi:hypothetical protein
MRMVMSGMLISIALFGQELAAMEIIKYRVLPVGPRMPVAVEMDR